MKQKAVPARKSNPPKAEKSYPKPPSHWKTNKYIYLFFFLLAFLLYGNTILNKYAVDDGQVADNELVAKGFKAIPEIFASRYLTEQGNLGTTSSDYRPVVKTTFALEYQLWGQKPGRSHVVNILLYWIIAVVLFRLLQRLLEGYNVMFPFLVTVLFIAHPIHTEVVASLKNRDEMLAFICGIGTLSLMLSFVQSRKWYYIPLAVVVFITGYLSKSSILPFVILIPLTLWFFTEKSGKTAGIIAIFLLILFMIAQFGPRLYLPDPQRVNLFIENPLFGEKNIFLRIGTGMVALLYYIRLLLFPHPLLYYYGYDMIPVVGMTNILALLSLFVHAGLLIIVLRNLRQKTILSFAILWYLIAVSMYSNVLFPVVGIIGERFVFTASLGFIMAITWILFKLFKTDPKLLTIEMDARLKILTLVFLLLVPMTAQTISRNRDWRNLYDLYRSDIRYLNNSAKANIDYAGMLMNTVYQDENFLRHGAVNQFKYQVIVSHFRRALTLYPDNYKTTNDLGTVYLFIGKNYDSAVYFLQKAIQLDSTMQPAWVNLGMAYREKKEFDKAIGCYEHILRVNPGQIKAVFALANVYNDMGQFDRAVQMNEDIMKKFPDLEMPYINIGNYHMLRRDTATAVSYWEKAAAIRPSFELCVQLNGLYLKKGDRQKADYYYDLGMELSKKGQ